MNADRQYRVFLARCIAVIATLLLGAGIISGATYAEYKNKVETAYMLALLAERKPADADLTADLVEYVESNFPATESVDWDGGRVETSNQWLLSKSAGLETENDVEQRALGMREIREYFGTIVFKMHELESASAQARSRDEEKRKLAEILRREEYQKPEPKGESAIARWLAGFLEWLEGLFSSSEPEARQASGSGLGSVIQFVVFALVFTILGYLLYRIVPLLVPSIRADRKNRKKKERIILGEKIGEDATADDLLGEAERLAKSGNLRGAIRKGYIALLCELADRKIIGLAHHKTNRDYLRDVRTRGELHPRMKVVTDTFERHWYGYQESDEADWKKFRDDYQEAIRGA